MNKSKKQIEDLEQELAILDEKRVEITSMLFSLKLKEAIVQQISKHKREEDSVLDINVIDITS